MLILVLTWLHLGIPYNLVNNLLGRTQPVTALSSTQRDWQSLCCLAQLLILSAVSHRAWKILQELIGILSVSTLRSLHIYWRTIYLWTNSFSELKLLKKHLWNAGVNSF